MKQGLAQTKCRKPIATVGNTTYFCSRVATYVCPCCKTPLCEMCRCGCAIPKK